MAFHSYSVLYKDSSNQTQQFCCITPTAWDARCAAMELNPYVHNHPNSITHIIEEKNYDW